MPLNTRFWDSRAHSRVAQSPRARRMSRSRSPAARCRR